MAKIEGGLDAKGLKIAIVTARFNELITYKLTEASIDCLVRHGANTKDITEVLVPGAVEISLAAEKLAASGKYDAIVCNGCVIRGETPHFDQVVNSVTSGVTQLNLKYSLPVIYGVLTTDTVEQAMNRSGVKAGNKGWDCALAAIEMANLVKKL
ncbi:MAG: 6,7-dimethyl-8-ribityllumazine synthase [Lentisphaeraceae bacterium]|nr:6,7-dimethyl-8-ribityllumazine synthase [Lentisphaeraceae bacterium]